MDLRPTISASLARLQRRRLRASVCAGAVVALAMTLVVVSLALASAPSFTDVPASHPYYEAISDLASRGVISGYPDDTFRPDNPVLRQHFAKMIVKALGYPVSEADICSFTDVPKSLPGSYVDPSDTNYPDHYVAVCAAQGITQGKTATTFDPYGNITRQQLITMVVRAASLPDPPVNYAVPFSSGQFYPEEHYVNARKADYAGLLAGLQGVGPAYNFMAPATRGECAQLLHNLIVYLTPPATTTTSSSTSTTEVTTTTTEVTTTTTSSSTTTTSSSTTTTSSTTSTTVPASGYYDVDTSPTNVDSSSPAVCSWASGRLDLFLIDGLGHLRHKWYSSSAWNMGWENLGGTLKMAYPPAAVSWGANRIDVFACGTNNHLMHLWWNGSTWSSWQDLGGALTSGPGVCSWAANRLDIFARGATGSCVHKWWDGAWSGWEDLGGVLQSGSAPAAVSWGSGRIDVFVRWTDNALWHRYYSSGWSSWSSHGGTLTSSPTVASWGTNHLDIFVRGADSKLWQLTWNPGWSSWTTRGGDSFVGAPTAVSWGSGRIDVFVINLHGEIWWKNYYSGTWHP